MCVKITIDSNLINARQKEELINCLEKLHAENKLQIVVSQRLLDEMHRNETMKKAQKYTNISEPSVAGHSRVGKSYAVGNTKKYPSFSEISKIIFPTLDELSQNQINDVMHLIAHCYSDSKYFITNNTKDFMDGKKTNKNRNLNLKNETRRKLQALSIDVLTPQEAVELFMKQRL